MIKPRQEQFILRYFPLLFIGGLLAVQWLHAILTELGDPLGLSFDIFLWIIACVLKIGTLISIFFLLSHAYSSIAAAPRAGLYAFMIWCACSMIIIGTLAWFRDDLSGVINTPAIQYFTQVNMSPDGLAEHGWLVEYSQWWLPMWRSGQIFAIEFGLAVVLAAYHAIVGVAFGKHSGAGAAVGVIGTLILLTLHAGLFDLFVLDWDYFHGDIFSGALLLDLAIFFIAIDPYTTISSLVYLGVLISCGIIARNPRATIGAEAQVPRLET